MMETNGATAGIVVRGRDKERRCLANPSRIVIWRPDHLGDLVLFSGLLRHFRRRWPSAHITLGVRSYGRALYAHCPYVDEMYPCEDGFSTFRAVPSPPGLDWLVRRYHQRRNRERGTNYGRFRDALRSDLTIFPIVSPGWRNHILLALMPSKARVGICGNLANQSHRTDLASRPLYDAQMDVSRMPRYYPEMEINRQFMAFLGIDVDAEQLWPEFWTAPADAETAKNLMDGSRSRLTLGIAPGVSSPKGKQLSAEWYAESLAGIDLSHFDIVLLGGKPDLSVCEQLAALLRLRTNAGGVLDLAGKTSILQLIECVRLCDLFIAPDAAPLHIATALRKPVVGILGGGQYGRFQPWGDPATTRPINKPMDCYGCDWHCKYETMRCIQEIPPAAAASVMTGLIANLQSGSAAKLPGGRT